MNIGHLCRDGASVAGSLSLLIVSIRNPHGIHIGYIELRFGCRYESQGTICPRLCHFTDAILVLNGVVRVVPRSVLIFDAPSDELYTIVRRRSYI